MPRGRLVAAHHQGMMNPVAIGKRSDIDNLPSAKMICGIGLCWNGLIMDQILYNLPNTATLSEETANFLFVVVALQMPNGTVIVVNSC
jgi:hypothetical protein